MVTRNRVLVSVVWVIPVILALLSNTGCHRDTSPNGVATAKAEPRKAPTTEEAIQAVKNNPNIPAQAKANILRQMQGKFASPTPANK